MSVYQPTYWDKDGTKRKSKTWRYKFFFAGREINESSKSPRKTVAEDAERKHRMDLERGFNDVRERRQQRIRTVGDLADKYLEDYRVRHPDSATFAEYALKHVKAHLGKRMSVKVSDSTVTDYQTERLKEKASSKTIDDEVGFLLRILEEQGDMIRLKLKRRKALKLPKSLPVGKAYTEEEKAAILQEAANRPRSRAILPALVLHLHTGLRAKELRNLQWSRVDLASAIPTVQVAESKTEAGQLRRIPLNATAVAALVDYSKWYLDRFGETRPEWYVFPFGNPRPQDPTKPQTTFKTVWNSIRTNTGITGRLHDTRHTWKTDLGESPDVADDDKKELGGWDSEQMLKHYSHARMERKRKGLASLERPLPKRSPAPPAKTTPQKAGG